jgi:SAM-dependent methyltransferase
MKTVDAITARVPRDARVLDFGSGPVASLSHLLREAGYEVVSFDPHFAPVAVIGEFDLVLAHEVFEHLRDVRGELAQIRDWLRPGGVFLIRSEPRPAREGFAGWWYARDFTHLFFASSATLRWIAREFGWEFETWSPQLWAFRRRG